MGILNITPDSHYSGGRYSNHEQALARALQMIEEGADLIDIGGESTRPGANEVPFEEELKRVLPVIKKLQGKIPLSIDTRHWQVAEQAVEHGVSFINDISGFSSKEMRRLAKKTKLQLFVMHMQKAPKTMQIHPSYPQGVIQNLLEWFEQRIALLLNEGIEESQLILDPGIGFGKSVDDNYKIINNLHEFKKIGYPLLIGLARKSFLYKGLNLSQDEVLPATLVMNGIAAMKGADYLRVYDVAAHRQVVSVVKQLNQRGCNVAIPVSNPCD